MIKNAKKIVALTLVWVFMFSMVPTKQIYAKQFSTSMEMNFMSSYLKLEAEQAERNLTSDSPCYLRYHKYRLGEEIDDLLKANDYNKSKWEAAIKDLIGSKGDTNRADDLIDLFNNGRYPSGI